MGELVFRYGTVSSAKTAELLVQLHTFTVAQGKKAWLIKSSVDTRNGPEQVWSRVPNLSRKADVVLAPDDPVPTLAAVQNAGIQRLYVDEVQFLTRPQIMGLWHLASRLPVFCYGLRTDFTGDLFPGSAALMALADRIEQLPSVCHFCERAAMWNLKHVGDRYELTSDEPVRIELGCEERYLPCCRPCVQRLMAKHEQ